MENDNEALDILNKILDKIQNNAKARKFLAWFLVIILLAASSFFIYGLLPKKYTLSISGGNILTNRHQLVKILQEEALKSGITLNIQPINGSVEALKAVSQGDLDIALVQGGLEKKFPNVDHVAALPPETVHILVKPEITSIEDLKGKVINMGTLGGGTRVVAKNMLDFVELKRGTDYVETNYSDEDLINMIPQYLPDAIVSISYMPSYLADYFIQKYGYKILNIAYSQPFSFRYTWAEEGQMLTGTYGINPDVPEVDINTIGVELELVANSNVNPKAISKFLDVLYNSSIENVVKQPIEEECGDSFSSFPLSAGTVAYMNRNNPAFTVEFLDRIKYLAGSAMALISTGLAIVKWLKGKKKDEETTEEVTETTVEVTETLNDQA